jgi:nicotinamidase/pyrazinamidase
MTEKVALLVVDLQNDFCSGGALPVPNGEQVIEPVNRATARFAALGLPVLASRDWHPPQARHFRQYGGLWPIHCVQGSDGAAFHPGLRLPSGTPVFSKGINPELDGYSAFEGVTGDGRPLESVLAELGIEHLYLAGLATDYCILTTALEAVRHGLVVTVLTDAVAGVDLVPGDSARAMQEMASAGVRLSVVDSLLGQAGNGR